MKKKLSLAIGTGMGDAIYQAARLGFLNIDWTKACFVTILSFLLVFLLYRKR